MTTDTEPRLAPPGAGLSLPVLAFARVITLFRRMTGNRESFNARFNQERKAIEALTKSCDLRQSSQRVLVGKLPGLEDSSRFWSVLMTLDHLRIVNNQIAVVIEMLGKGVTPKHKASTAAVKPSPDVGPEVVETYNAACDKLLAAVAEVSNLKTKTRFAHPWFGPMDAHGWHSLSAGHMGIHRRQIESILQNLRKPD